MSNSDLDGIVRRKPRAVAGRGVQRNTLRPLDGTTSKPEIETNVSPVDTKPSAIRSNKESKKASGSKSPIWDDADRQTQLSAGQVPRVFSEAVHRFAAEQNTSLRVLILKGLKMQGLDVPDLALVDKRRNR